MNREQLRELQRPWKDKFRQDAAAAVVDLRAVGTLDPAEIVCQLAPRAREARAGLHPLTGGDGSTICAAELLLDALVACAGVTLLAVSTSLEIPVQGGEVEAAGRLDFRGTLGVDRNTPVGFSSISLILRLHTTATEDQLVQLLNLTERYCVVYQTLQNSTPITSEIKAS